MRAAQAASILRGEVAGLASNTILRQASVVFADYPLRSSCSVGAVSSLKAAITRIDEQGEQIEPANHIRRVFRSLDQFVWENYNSVPELHQTISVLIRLQGLSFREQKIETTKSAIFTSLDPDVSVFREVPQSTGLSIFTAHWTNSAEAEKDRDWLELRKELLRREQAENGVEQTEFPRASLFGSIWRGLKRKAVTNRTTITSSFTHDKASGSYEEGEFGHLGELVADIKRRVRGEGRALELGVDDRDAETLRAGGTSTPAHWRVGWAVSGGIGDSAASQPAGQRVEPPSQSVSRRTQTYADYRNRV